MKKIIYTVCCLFTFFSCTKEIDDDIFGGIDVEQLIDNPEVPLIDPITGEPIDDDLGGGLDNPEVDPITGEPTEEEPMEEEVDPSLSGENTLLGWQIFDGNAALTAINEIQDGNILIFEYPVGTNLTNITIAFSLPDKATVEQSTTGLNFTINDGVKVFNVVAENGAINTYAFDISINE